jgi:hypothetical protein
MFSEKKVDVNFTVNLTKKFLFHFINSIFVWMKTIVYILLFVFVTFLVAPTVVRVIEKNTDVSVFFSFSDEEKDHKEIKAVFDFDFVANPVHLSQLNSGLIHSENLSKHDLISSKIFIPPPEQG